MQRRTKERGGYTEAAVGTLAASRGKPVPEAAVAEAVLEALRPQRCIRLRRYYARSSWVKTGHTRKSWKPRNVTAHQEALLGAAYYARRSLYYLIKVGQVKKQVGPNKERLYSLVARNVAPRKKKGG